MILQENINIENSDLVLKAGKVHILNSSGLISIFDTNVFIDVLEGCFSTNVHKSNIIKRAS